jgi:hypothetical protein
MFAVKETVEEYEVDWMEGEESNGSV